MVRIFYSGESFQVKARDFPSTFDDREFDSLDEAKSAPMPVGTVFAYINVPDGEHVYTDALGWEFHKS